MAIAIQSTGSTTYGTSSVAIPKPTGLAVGDLMIAFISIGNSNGFSYTGWTLVGSSLPIPGAEIVVLKKVATSGDVAASTFTFICSNSPQLVGGIIYRITGANFNNIQFGEGALTPTVASNLVILCGGAGDNDSDYATFSGYSVTGGMSPTFTENFDTYGTNSANYASMGVASGLYTSSSTITAFNITITEVTSVDFTGKGMLLIGETPAVGPTNLKSLNTNLKANIKSINGNLIANVKSYNTIV
jgi:hypothetical protein